MTSRFKLRQVPSATQNCWNPLSFGILMEGGPTREARGDPVIAQVCGTELDYGRLFAYCFRRFGYPESSWDNDKELAAYCLATPHPGLVLRVTPNRSNSASLSLQFLASDADYAAVHDYASRERTEWTARAWAWVEAHEGLPEWADAWAERLRAEWASRNLDSSALADSRAALQISFLPGPSGTDLHQGCVRAFEYRNSVLNRYREIEPWPTLYRRPFDLSKWAAEDPLKPLADAAIVALTDLARPVELRDGALTAYGPLNSPSRASPAAKSAGYTVGTLVNGDPDQFAQLHEFILALGADDPKKGLRQVLDILRKTHPEHAN